MIDRICSRLRQLATITRTPGAQVPGHWDDPAPVLATLETFVADGGAGYLLATAGKVR